MRKVLALALFSGLLALSGCMLMHGDHMGHHQTDESRESRESSRPGGDHSH